MEKADKADVNSFLSFQLGGEIFASNVDRVLNILEVVRITKVPNAPIYMQGVINLRGEALPVIDTRVKFGMPAIEVTGNTCILVLEIEENGNGFQVGALVDSVLEVMEVEANIFKPVPAIGDKYKTEYIKSMLQYNEQFIMVLDIDKVFTTDEIISLPEITMDTLEMEEL